MQSISKKAFPLAVATVALSTVVMVNSDAAHAFSITQTGGVNSTVSGATTINFNGLSGNVPTSATPIGPNPGEVTIQKTSGTATYSSTGAIPTGSPVPYLNIGSGNFTLNNGTVAFQFSNPLNYFGLYWGSLDILPTNANIVTFFKGSTQVGAFTGVDIATALPGIQTLQSQYINFFSSGTSELFDRVVLSNPGLAAFEVDNLAYRQVPTPVLLPGLVAMGIGVLRKRKTNNTEEVRA